LIIDGKSKHDNVIDDWVNNFCKQGNISVENMICIAYYKDNEKYDKQKTSNQFPKLNIYESDYDINNFLPIFNKYVYNLLDNLGNK